MNGENAKRPFFRAHLFCCLNSRAEDHPRGSCAAGGSVALYEFMNERAEEMGLEGVRINSAGCLDRCEKGPAVVIYPEGVWYRCANRDDAEEILTRHLRDGKPVEPLMLGPDD
jgi:(2Fe-2S) ferredoxin